MLVVAEKDAVVAIVFDEEISSKSEDGLISEIGVKYRYRFLDVKAGKTTQGSGLVVDKYKATKIVNKRVMEAVDVGSVGTIKGGTVQVRWYYQGPGCCWIQYIPERTTVQIAYRRDFEKINLERFKKN